MPKNLERALGFLKLQFAAKKIKKFEGGTLWRQKMKKNSIEPTIERKDPIVSSGFVSYVKNGVNEKGGPLH